MVLGFNWLIDHIPIRAGTALPSRFYTLAFCQVMIWAICFSASFFVNVLSRARHLLFAACLLGFIAGVLARRGR